MVCLWLLPSDSSWPLQQCPGPPTNTISNLPPQLLHVSFWKKKKKTTFLLLFLFRMFCYHVASYGFILLEDNIFRHKPHSRFLEYPPPRARYPSSNFICFLVWCGFIVSFTCSRGVQSPACPCFASGAALLFKRHFNVMLCIYKMFLDFILDFSISCFFHLPF